MHQMNLALATHSRLIELMNEKPFNPVAFRQGHTWATRKRRQQMVGHNERKLGNQS